MKRALDTETFVVLGEGLAAGVGHFSLTDDVQESSFPALVAEKLDTNFEQPLVQPPGVGDVGFQPLPAEILSRLLLEQGTADSPEEAERLASLAEGSLQRAKDLAQPELGKFRELLVAELAKGFWKVGKHNVIFDAAHLSSGLYFTELRAGNLFHVQKITLIK